VQEKSFFSDTYPAYCREKVMSKEKQKARSPTKKTGKLPGCEVERKPPESGPDKHLKRETANRRNTETGSTPLRANHCKSATAREVREINPKRSDRITSTN